MVLPREMERALTDRFRWWKGTVPELDEPELLIVFNYSPCVDDHPLSIAFDSSGGNRCWMSAQTRHINDKGPNPHADYRTFKYNQTTFNPYSIQAFPNTIFSDIEELERACATLYQYAVFD